MMTRQENRRTRFVPEPIPLDGGWAWMIVVGAFVAYFVADGWSYSFGAFYPYILEYLHEGKGKTALVGALLYGIPLIISPFVCVAVECFGCRRVTICGGFIMALSFILSMFAKSVDTLCLTIGVFGSIGLAMTYVPTLVIVTFYFDRYRGLATGLAVTGSGLGSFAMPPLVELFITRYGIQGSLLMLAGISLYIIVAGALYRPPKMTTEKCTNDESAMKNGDDSSKGSCAESNVDMSDSGNLYRDISGDRHDSTESLTLLATQTITQSSTGSVNISPTNDDVLVTETAKQHKSIWQHLRPALKSMFDAKLLKIWPFVIFCASSFLTYLWSGVVYIYLVDHAMTQGISMINSVFLLSITGIARTVGQLLLGAVGDVKWINTLYLYGGCIALAGVSIVLLPFCNGMITLSIFSVAFGFFISVTYSLQMMCIVLAVGMANTTNAFGMVQLIQGVATLLGTPVIGWLYEATGHYDTAFYTSGACVALSGVVLLAVPRSTGVESVNEQNTSTQNTIEQT